MCAIQRNQPYNRQGNPPPQNQPQQNPPEPRYRFRWELWLGLPLLVAIFLWFVGGIELAFSFVNIMAALGVAATSRYLLLACLGIVCITVLLAVKVLRNR